MFRSAIISVFTLCLFLNNALAQSSSTKKYATQELIEDLKFYSKAITKNHPELYISIEEDSVSTARNKINSYKSEPFLNRISYIEERLKEQDSLTEIEFYRKLAELNYIISCVHTDVRLSENLDKWWKENALLVPFNVLYKDGAFFISQNYSNNPSLEKGTEIHAINNNDIGAFRRAFFLSIPSDGMNLTRKEYALRKGFYRYYSYYLQLSAPEYTLTITPYGSNEKQTIKVKGITKTEFNKRRKEAEKTAPINFSFIDSIDAALLTVPTFRNDLFEDANIQFSKYLDSVFSLLNSKNTKHLIIDLRGNGGGYSEYGAQLLTYLIDTSFEYSRNMWLASDTLKPYIQYYIPETFGGFPSGIEKHGGSYKWTKHSVLGWRQPSKNNFKGQVYFLIDGGCVSTTSEVASIAKENNMGVFIGEEVGGKYAGDNGGVLGWVELPNTKIKVRIALVEYELAVTDNNSGYGVKADYSNGDATIKDFVLGNDKDLELAISLIEKKK